VIISPPEPAARARLQRRAGAAGGLGAVAASSPVAAAIGTAALLSGGNCVDAALAAALAETVVLAPKCGLAGDVVALHLAAGSGRLEALVAVGPAAVGLGDAVADRGTLAATGGLSVGVPGAPAGYAALAGRGRLPLAELCAPAIALARRGVAWPAVAATLAAEADELLVRHQPTGCRYRPASGPLPAGAHLRLPGLASVLEAFAAGGAALFHGSIGAALVAKVRAAGGVMTADDLRRVEAEWSEPARLRLGDRRTLWATPGPTYGPALLAALDRSSTAGVGALPEIVARVLADHGRHAGDGRPWRPEGTSVVAAADAEGGAVVVVHSNSFPQFGSGLVVEELDLVLSNRAGRGFSAEPASANFPHPGRRPQTTLHAWALGDHVPQLLGGTPGGAQQVPWNAQVITRLLDGADPGAAVTAPLWRLDQGRVVAEDDRFDPSGDITPVPPLSLRSAQVVVAPARGGGLARAWADPRQDTLALAV
jgi:gamma-glutamyltranspeptidase/glutathione hydrolase